MVRSAIEPNWYFLKEIEQKDDGIEFVLRLRWNVHPVTIEDLEGGTHTEYEYDEQILKHQPSQTISIDEVTSYIESCKEELLAEAQNVAGIQGIAELDIDSVRKQPLKPAFVGVKKKTKADIAANPIPESVSATPADIKSIKIRVENIEKLLGLQ